MVVLQGNTLGQRHAYYNSLFKKEAAKTPADLPKINYDEPDVDNMIKIDIACHNRNVDFIIDVLKCDDMLFISRAIMKSSWLVRDKQYAHIINPTYLHRELFPHMNAKAVIKLLLHIRLCLRDEARVKDFYWYVYKRNPKQAVRWLQYCSTNFIESRMPHQANEICPKLMLRLCKKSFKILKLWMHHNSNSSFIDNLGGTAKYWMRTHTDEYLDLIVRKRGFFTLGVQDNFNKKWTIFLLKNCYKMLMEKYTWYCDRIHINTLIDFIKVENIKSFCIKIAKIHGNCWSYNNLTPFLNKMPRGEVLDLLRTILAIQKGTWIDPDEAKTEHSNIPSLSINESNDEDKKATPDVKEQGDVEELFYELEGGKDQSKTFNYIYRWYQHIPYEVAFPDIQKFIYAESDPEERHNLLITLLNCAKYDFEHVKTVVKYYHDKHINEPYVRKIKFVESFIMGYDTAAFDDSTWEILNNLYKSLELYVESTNKLQECVVSVIVRSALRDQPVDKVVEEKYIFETLKDYRCCLDEQQQDKLFNYLHNLLVTKLNNQSTDSETGLHEAIGLLRHLWSLIRDWKREKTHYQFVIDKIAEFGEINRTSKWTATIKKRRLCRRKQKSRKQKNEWGGVIIIEPFINIPSLYAMVKPYRRALFENSLVLNACEEVCLNALKHDPGLLLRYDTETEDLRVDNRTCLKRFLRKLRIYWPDTLAKRWAEISLEKASQKSGHKALVRGLLVVLPHEKALEFIKMYAPDEKKINWENDEKNATELSIQKVIAKSLHLVRPQLPIEVIMWYAKGDYLQFSLRSLLAAYATLRRKDIRRYIDILLDSPVSILKHGIRLAFAKFTTEELIVKSEQLWRSTKNSSIRTILFTSIMDLLCKEKKESLIKELWGVLRFYMDDLTKEENNIIYDTISGRVRDVPYLVIGEYFPKAYFFVQSLRKGNDDGWRCSYKYALDRMFEYAVEIVEYLECDFIENTLLVNVEDHLIAKTGVNVNLLTNYLLHSQDLCVQAQKYNNLLRPVVEKYISRWKKGEAQLKDGLNNLLHHICRAIPRFAFEKEMVMPVELVTSIGAPLIENLQPFIEEHYSLIAYWEITLAYLRLIETMHSKDPEASWETIRSQSTEGLSKICLQRLTGDVAKFFPSIYLLFKHSMQNLFSDFTIDGYDKLNVLDKMLDGCDNEAVYLHVFWMMPSPGSHKFEVVRSKLYCHPSKELRFHYVQWYSSKYEQIVVEEKES